MNKIQLKRTNVFLNSACFAILLLSATLMAHAVAMPQLEDPAKPAEQLSDEELSDLAKQAIGTDPFHTSRKCTSCHRLSSQLIKSWGGRFADISQNCFQNKKIADFSQLTSDEASRAIQCLKTNSADPRSPFHPSRLGFWAGAADHMGPLFERTGLTNWQNDYRQFLSRVRMPMNRSSSGFTPYQVDVLSEWIKRNYVHIDALDNGANPPPEIGCTPLTSNDLKQMITSHHQRNWGTVNKSKGVIPFACSPRKPSDTCFQMKDSRGQDRFQLIQNIKRYKTINQSPNQWNIRYVTRMPYNTIFWTRSSADGRFSAAGVSEMFDGDEKVSVDIYSAGAAITDLMPLLKGEPPRVIPVHASFDPAFFADNSGFSIQGLNSKDNKAGGTLFCPQSVLLDKNTKEITNKTKSCSQAELSLYHSTAVSLKGDDYFAIAGDFSGDAGDSDDESGEAFTPEESFLTFMPMLFDGQKFARTQNELTLSFQYEIDFMISASSDLISSRAFAFDPKKETLVQNGYNLHQLIRKTKSNGEFEVETQLVGRVCTRGGKAPISTNQRFLTFYRFVRTADYKEFGFASPNDDEFQNLLHGPTSNIYVYDLLTQKTHRVTNMQAGERAVFSHFRTDDWLVFIVKEPYRDDGSAREHMMVSDIAIKLNGP